MESPHDAQPPGVLGSSRFVRAIPLGAVLRTRYIIPMTAAATPTAAQLAALLAGIRAEADHHAAHAGLVATLHALILAALARLIGRFADLFALWRSGQLPPLVRDSARPSRPAAPHAQTRRPAARNRSAASPATRRAAHCAAHRADHRAAHRADQPAPAASRSAPIVQPRQPPQAAIFSTSPMPTPRTIAPARGPPRSNAPWAVALRHAQNVP